MFHYKFKRNKSQLEVDIQHAFNDSDFERMLLFIEALLDAPNDLLVFKVIPEVAEQFQKSITSHKGSFSNYKITVNAN